MKKREIIKLFKEKNYKKLKEVLNETSSVDMADLLNQLDEEQSSEFLQLLSKSKIEAAFSKMDKEMCEKFIKRIVDIELNSDVTDDVIDDLPKDLVSRILKKMPSKDRKRITQFLTYPANSVGKVMSLDFVDLKSNMTVSNALTRIKELSIDSKAVYTCYVLDSEKKLIGIVDIKDMLVADRSTLIKDLMKKDFVSIQVTEKQKKAAKLISKYTFYALPIVDSENKLLGVLTIDVALSIMKKETTRELNTMSALHPDTKNYFETSVFRHAKNRITWLLILMFSAILTGSIISKYEKAFEVVPLLVSFIPMIMDTGGNCGSQSSTLIIRGLATEEIKLKDIFRVLWKEIRVSLLVGVVLALVNGLRIYLQYKSFTIALTIGLTLIATATFAKVIGCLLPMLAKKLKLDPAIMAAPLITTLVDTFSILIYFNIAMAVLGIK